MTKYLVSGYIGFDNFGDEAIAKVLTSYLKSQNPKKITLISSNPKKTSDLYDVNAVGMLNFLPAIKECDVLISGGGSLLQDITSLKSLIYYLTIIFLGIFFKKKVIIFAQGFTPFRTKFGEFLTKIILKKCTKIYVRDIKSQELLKNLKINSELISDPVFGIETKSSNHQGIGVQLRSFQTINDDFLNKLALEIKNNFNNEEIKLISLQDSLDLDILNKFSQILAELNIKNKIYNDLSVEKATKILSELEYLIGMRFHANLIAAKSKVKVLGINYDIKVETLANNINFPLINFDEDNFNPKFQQLINIDTNQYNIPTFNFPDIT